MGYVVTKIGTAQNVPIWEIECDGLADLAGLPTQTIPKGSRAHVMVNNRSYVLNSQGSWVEQLPLGGLQGKSAYEVAVENGFVGSEEDWLFELQGKEPRIDPDTKTWLIYDPVREEYVDTEVRAEVDIDEIVEAVIEALPNGDEEEY